MKGIRESIIRFEHNVEDSGRKGYQALRRSYDRLRKRMRSVVHSSLR